MWEKSERAVLIAITLRRASVETQLGTPSPRTVTLTVELPNTACGWYNIGDSQSSPGTPETQASGSVKIVPLPHVAIYASSELNQSLSSSHQYFWSTYHVPGTPLDTGNIPWTKVSLQSSWSLFYSARETKTSKHIRSSGDSCLYCVTKRCSFISQLLNIFRAPDMTWIWRWENQGLAYFAGCPS